MIDVGEVVGLVVLAVLLAAFGLTFVRALSKYRANRDAPVRQVEAVVLSHREQVVSEGESSSSLRHLTTFALADGRRLELEIRGFAPGWLPIGQAGILSWQGEWFRAFEPQVLR